MNINLKTIKDIIAQAEKLQQLVDESKNFVLSLDVDNVTIAEYQRGLKYLVDILNIIHKPLEE